MNIREMRENDLDQVIKIEKTLFNNPWSKNMFQDELNYNLAHYFVAEEEGDIIGYCGLRFVLYESHVCTICVSEVSQNRGVGQELFNKMIEFAKKNHCLEVTLEVGKTNSKAIGLYAKNGLKPVGIRKNYYGSEDAIIMTGEIK